MEDIKTLESHDELHLYALHHIYIPAIHASPNEFVNQWNYLALFLMPCLPCGRSVPTLLDSSLQSLGVSLLGTCACFNTYIVLEK